jgi:phage terminase large subunit-like protein
VAVLRGDITVGRFTFLAVKRHYVDLKKGAKRGLWFDPTRAAYMIDFFPKFLRHIRGELTGKPITLEPWQMFWRAVQFGWRRQDGTRRFRQWYEEVARKNGKSTTLSGIGLHLTAFDGEPGAKVYTGATKLDQAKITHGDAELMREFSPGLKRLFKNHRNRLFIEGTANEFLPLGADAKTLDGLDPHGALMDELHAHRTRELWDVLVSAMGARREPMLTAITTAGFNQHGICYEQRQLLADILEGRKVNDSVGGVIYTLDEGDDWADERLWIKANPNLGVSVKLSYLREQVLLAKQVIAQQVNVLTKNLNIWCQQDDRWLDIPGVWDLCNSKFDLEQLEGRVCYGGLDLSTETDLTAFVLVFEPIPEDPHVYVVPYFFVPADNINRRAEMDRVAYPKWVAEQHLEATPGNVVDYERVRAVINECAARFEIKEIGYDPWNASHLVTQLMGDGRTMVKLGQNLGNLSAPTKRLEGLLLSKVLKHGGHPVLRWNAENVALLRDSNGNYRPHKGKSRERIDGIAALLNALNRYMGATTEEPEGVNAAYSNGGIRTT